MCMMVLGGQVVPSTTRSRGRGFRQGGGLVQLAAAHSAHARLICIPAACARASATALPRYQLFRTPTRVRLGHEIDPPPAAKASKAK